ncbi:hypothetical protein UlMin_010625 [Ulmus minor]
MEKSLEPSPQNPRNKKRKPLGPSKVEAKKKRKQKQRETTNGSRSSDGGDQSNNEPQPASAATQLRFLLDQFQYANGVNLSSLELESIKDACILELSQDADKDVNSLGKHLKGAFGSSWKEVLCGKQLVEGKVDPGSPAVLIISPSALRSIELLKGLQSLTKECHAAKLFSKHIKVEEQVSLLKNRVNIASGTPSRIKKLIDIEALGLSRLGVIVFDIRPDVKGYSLFTLPQVSDEFWDLYKNYFHQRLLEGFVRVCLYGQIPNGNELQGKKRSHCD